jgi:cytoskeleton protein RodZ
MRLTTTTAPPEQPPSGLSVGDSLRTARERAGLTVDDVSAQLKLAPRQVRALEEDQHDQLPGKAFVRGFVRNYARLLHLDGDALVARLEPPAVDPTAFEEAIAPSRGELPGSERRATTLVKWVVPALLLIAVVAGAYFEWKKHTAAEAQRQAAAPAIVEAPAPPPPAVTSSNPEPVPPSPVTPAAAAPAAVAPAPENPAPAAKEPAAPAKKEGEAELVFSFGDRSWLQVRDGDGRVLVSETGAAGSTRTIAGKPPLTVTIGNSRHATLTYNGKAVNLAPHRKQDVARLTLK